VAEQVVAYAPGFEGAGWLEGFEFEVDSAFFVSVCLGGPWVLWLERDGWGTHQPAALERAADSTRGVLSHSFGVCAIVGVLVR